MLATLNTKTWRSLLSRMIDLARTQNIPSIQEYADAWNNLAADFEEIGLLETTKNCRARFEQYRILEPGEYIRLIDQPTAELIRV